MTKSFKEWINHRFSKIKNFFKEYFVGKYKFLFVLSLLNVLFIILTNLFPNNIFLITISFILATITIFIVVIFSHFIFLHKKINLKNSFKALAFFLLNFLISFFTSFFFLLIVIFSFYNKLLYYLNLNNFTQQDILEMQKLNFYYSLFYPLFLIILFLLFYLLTFSLLFSVYYYVRFGFKKGLKKFWKGFLSKKNFFFFLFFIFTTLILNQLSELNYWFNLLNPLLIFPFIKYFHFIEISKEEKDFYLLLFLSLILFIFNLLLLKL